MSRARLAARRKEVKRMLLSLAFAQSLDLLLHIRLVIGSHKDVSACDSTQALLRQILSQWR